MLGKLYAELFESVDQRVVEAARGNRRRPSWQ